MIDIIIVGGGISGLTSALYCLRANKTVLILEKETIGGQIASSPKVENFPGTKSISGIELANNLFDQVTDLGGQFELDNVQKIEKIGNIFHVICESTTYECKAVVIATGLEKRKINLPNEDKLVGHGLSYCAVCDGAFYSNSDVCVVGDGNTSLQYALLLSGYCKHVYLCTLFDKFFGEQKLVDRVKQKSNIQIVHNASLTKLNEIDNELSSLEFTLKDNSIWTLLCSAVFIAIGQVPDNARFSNLVNLSSDGYIEADELMQTKTSGLFVAGDCRNKKIRQLTTAVSDGAVSGISAYSYINNMD